MKSIKGFTIVELLIVIVVIAILAAISVVAYNGIQNRAKNSQTVSAVKAYYSALSLYLIDNSSLPTNHSCLGPQEFYNSNPCYIGSGTYNYNASVNSSFANYISNTPTLPTGRAVGTNASASGIFYYPNGSYIGFPVFSSSTCPEIGGATLQSSTVLGGDIYCRINFPTA